MKFLKEGFDVFVLESFEDKSGCRILDLQLMDLQTNKVSVNVSLDDMHR